MAFVPDPQPAATGFVPDAPAPAAATPPAPAEPEESAFQRGLRYVTEYTSGFPKFRDLVGLGVNAAKHPIETALGAGEAGLQTVTGALAPITSAPAWIANQTLGDRSLSSHDAMADYTYQPRSEVGQIVGGAVGHAFQPFGDTLGVIEQGWGNLGSWAGAPFGQEDLAQELVGGLAGRFEAGAPVVKGGLDLRAASRHAAENAPPAAGPIVGDLRSAGYPVMPSQASAIAQRGAPPGVMPSVPGELRETLVNKGETRGRFSVESAKNTERLLRNEFGLPEGTPVNPATLEGIAQQANGAYDLAAQAAPVIEHTPAMQALVDQIGALRRDNPYLRNAPEVEALRGRLAELNGAQVPTQKVLDAIREFRSDSRKYFQSVDNPVAHEIAKSYRAAADALEQGIADTLQRTGNAHIFEQFQNARVLQAKIHNVLDAWSGRELDPQALARLGQDVKLSGNLATIAQAATDLPDTLISTTGTTISRPTNAGTIMDQESALRRLLFDRFIIPNLLSPEFQNRFGRPGAPNVSAPFALQGPVGNPDVGPQSPPPPPGGRFPHTPAGEGPLGLAPEGGGLPFEGSQLPPVGGEGVSLADALRQEPALPARFQDLPFDLEGPLDNPAGGPRLGEFGTEPMQATPGVQPGASIGLADDLMPEQPSGALNVSPEPRGPNAPRPRGGQPPADMRVAPENAHELPGSILDLLTSPEGKSLVDELLGGWADQTGPSPGLGAQARDLGTDLTAAPEPMAPEKGSKALRPIRDELNTEPPAGETAAAPDEFSSILEDMGLVPPKAPRANKAPAAAAPPAAPKVAAPKAEPTAPLTVDEAPAARPAAPDLADDGLSTENLPRRQAGDVSIKMTRRPPSDIIPRRALPEKPIVYHSGPAGNPSRWLVLEDKGTDWNIKSIDTTAFKSENPEYHRPPGRELYVMAARDAKKAGVRLNSDTDMSRDAVEAIARAVDDGELTVDNWDQAIAAARAALEESGGKRISRGANGGAPWFTNIRPTE